MASISFARPPSDIHAAARVGDVVGLADLLAAAPELVNARTRSAETPLHYAILGRQQLAAELLVAFGADVNEADAHGRTPLHVAALADERALLELLVAAGADVNATDQRGQTPLHLAAARFRAEALRALLEAGAAVRAQNDDGETPLHVLGAAARERDNAFARRLSELADLLIEYGADPRIIADGIPALRLRPQEPGDRAGYPTYEQITQMLQDRAQQYPDLCRLQELGLSVLGRNLWALNITDSPGTDEDEPEFKYISTMHGDEWTGMEMCLYLIDYLLANYGIDPRVTNIVNEIDLWIVPVMNPDGFVAVTRENAHGVDLNRNFPEWVKGEPNSPAGREPETAAIMNWTFAHAFTCSANFHGGALVVNYPFDNDGIGSVFSPTPDEDLFVCISEEYSRYNPPMWSSPYFYHGITNGADWYAISGGMQDWNYRYEGDNEVTIELSNSKIPPYSQMPQFWQENRESLLAYLETCLLGVRGIISDAAAGAPLAATVTVVDRDHEIYSDAEIGDYHRMLLPGAYELHFDAPAHDPVTIPVAVTQGAATRLDVALGPPTRVLYPNGGEVIAAGATLDIQWQGSPDAQFHIQYTPNYGQSSAVSDGFESGTLDSEYSTGGAAAWFATTLTAHSGKYAARAGDITHGQQSWLTRGALGGPVGFWYYISSQSGHDFFNFYVDGLRKLHKSGNVGWTHYAIMLPPGEHALKWDYVKDTSGDSGGDTALVDDASFTADLTAWVDVVALTLPGATAVAWTPTQPGDAYKVRVRAYYGQGRYGAWDESDGMFAVSGAGFEAGDLNCNGSIDVFDIDPFVLALSDPGGYDAAYPDCDRMLADVNSDGVVDAFDIDPFVALLTGG